MKLGGQTLGDADATKRQINQELEANYKHNISVALKLNNCAICQIPKQGQFVFQPCGHGYVCRKCVETVLGIKTPCCPICGDEINECQKI